MRRFVLVRDLDVSGISGTGVVVWGIQFPDGRVTYRGNTATATTCVAEKVADLVLIHGHDGATRLVWLDSVEEAQVWHEEESRGRPAL